MPRRAKQERRGEREGTDASGHEPISSSVPGGSTWGFFYLARPPRLVLGTEWGGLAGPCQRCAPNDISCLVYPKRIQKPPGGKTLRPPNSGPDASGVDL